MDQLGHVKVYIKIDYCGIYKLPCETHYDHFKYVVMTLTLQMNILFFSVNSVNDFEICYIDNFLFISLGGKILKLKKNESKNKVIGVNITLD